MKTRRQQISEVLNQPLSQIQVGKTGLIRRYTDEEWVLECERRRKMNEPHPKKEFIPRTILRKST